MMKLKDGQKIEIFQNPDFDEVFLFHKLEVPTSKKEFKPVEIQIQKKVMELFPDFEKTLYVKGNKENSINFIREVKDRLNQKKKKTWPYKNTIMLTIGFMGTKKSYGNKDLDNLVKSVFDAFKEIVFVDDNQVEILITSKQIIDKSMNGFMVGLKIIDEKTIEKFLPPLYSIGENIWEKNWSSKFKNKLINKDDFNTFEIY